MQNYTQRIEQAKALIADADYVIVGAGAGLSTAAGFEYAGANFAKYFPDFIAKYGFRDMYSAGFYPFASAEEKWAYWSRYVYVNRYQHTAPNPVYAALLALLKNKNYFVITTNVDHQFQIAGFDQRRLFYMQGDYGLLQCSVPCHQRTYDNRDIILKMVQGQKNMRIPSNLLPKCPVCGQPMTMNLRADERFVQDDGWYAHARAYQDFLAQTKGKKVVLIEIGVGYNTPSIIKYPFENMVARDKNTALVRMNRDDAICPDAIQPRTILFDEDVQDILQQLVSPA